jgi:dihydropteroate synthase
MRLIQTDKINYLISELRQIGVDDRSLEIFTAKAQNQTVKFEGLSAAQVNILKQTALVCGADLAIPREAYEKGNRRRYPALLFANRREIGKIIAQLAGQPWMDSVARDLSTSLRESELPRLKIGRVTRVLRRTHIMGIINLTPDSFYPGSRYPVTDGILATAEKMTCDGADFLDLGAESTHPGSDPLPVREEINRLKPVLKKLAGNIKIPISVDTYKSEVAAFALDHGAQIINDISGLGRDRKMAGLVARRRAALVIMHIQGLPKNMQDNPYYENLMQTLFDYFRLRLTRAAALGIEPERIIIDPGLGFGKRLNDNYEIINRLAELTVFNRPILVGHSRKSFIGNPFGLPPEERLEGSLAAQALLIKNGASIIRVHDIRAAKRAALLADLIRR